jgi:hypothetical protein
MLIYIAVALVILLLIMTFYSSRKEGFGVWPQFVREHHPTSDPYNTCGLTQLNIVPRCDNGPHDGFR